MSGLVIQSGTCHPLFCFEVGYAIDLDAAERASSGAERPPLPHRERPAGPFEFRPAPLRVSEPLGETRIAPFALGPTVDLVLYDFGAASVSYTIPLGAGPAELIELSVALRGHAGLLADARRRIARRVEALGAAIQRPAIAERVEDYFIFQLREIQGRPDASALCVGNAELLARGLRAEGPWGGGARTCWPGGAGGRGGAGRRRRSPTRSRLGCPSAGAMSPWWTGTRRSSSTGSRTSSARGSNPATSR